jgi:hypothetical protein
MSDVRLEIYKADERRMAAHEARRGIRIHVAVTVVVVAALGVVNVFAAPEFPWSVFPAFGMSLGVWFHWYFGVHHGEEFMLRRQEEVEREAERNAA